MSQWPDPNREDLRDVVNLLVDRGEIEVVPTTSGEVLYVLQSLDELVDAGAGRDGEGVIVR